MPTQQKEMRWGNHPCSGVKNCRKIDPVPIGSYCLLVWVIYLIPSSIFFISVIALFTCVCLFFSTSRSFLKHFLQLLGPFLHSFSEILDYLHFLYPKLFFSSKLPISTSLCFSSGVLSCSFIWNTFFCHLILSKFL